MASPNATWLLSRLFVMIAAVLAVAALYLAKVVFLPLAFAILIAFLLAPLVGLLERIRLPRTLAAALICRLCRRRRRSRKPCCSSGGRGHTSAAKPRQSNRRGSWASEHDLWGLI